jgi:hypothetical protein
MLLSCSSEEKHIAASRHGSTGKCTIITLVSEEAHCYLSDLVTIEALHYHTRKLGNPELSQS